MPKRKIVKKCKDDKFYTNSLVAKECVDLFNGLGLEYDKLIEPSAGKGSFSNLFDDIIALDISPDSDNISKCDYFNYIPPRNSVNAIIGNPPFGERNNLSKAFIKKAMVDTSIISFVLPEVFSKPINQRIFGDGWKLILSHKLNKDSFLLKGEPYHVPCVFQVWTKLKTEHKNLKVEYVIPKGTNDWTFVKKGRGDFFTFGSAPHKLLNVEDVNNSNRGYYIKVKDEKNIDKIKEIFYSGDWYNHGRSSASGGVYWMTKQELVDTYNLLNGEVK